MYSNINAELARIGMSRSKLANELGVSYGTVKNWIRGSTQIPCSKLIEMSKKFHCSTDYLLGLDDTTTENISHVA